jgi:uncharacterized membrane protein
MLCIGGISFAAGIVFLMLGAWPVFGFFGLDVALVYWAFRANYRAARAYEEVTVTATELTVRKISQRGEVREWTLNPVWVRLDRIVHEEFGIERILGPRREEKFRHRAVGGAGRSQARADAHRYLDLPLKGGGGERSEQVGVSARRTPTRSPAATILPLSGGGKGTQKPGGLIDDHGLDRE